jgi:hypothetical protein
MLWGGEDLFLPGSSRVRIVCEQRTDESDEYSTTEFTDRPEHSGDNKIKMISFSENVLG